MRLPPHAFICWMSAFTSNSYRALALQQSDATCQFQTLGRFRKCSIIGPEGGDPKLDSPSSADHGQRQSTQWRASPYTILTFSRNQTKVLARKYVHFQSQVAAG